MKKWYFWLVLALIWVLGGVINYFDRRSITSSIVVASILTFLGLAQLICDQKGEKGKKVFRYLSIGVIALVCLAVLILLIIKFV